jgi:hypothetical protein
VQNQLTPEQQIAVQCVAETGGQPYAAVGCAATQLTVGEDRGCFGNNNDLVGRNGWTARTFSNVVSDIHHAPVPTMVSSVAMGSLSGRPKTYRTVSGTAEAATTISLEPFREVLIQGDTVVSRLSMKRIMRGQ